MNSGRFDRTLAIILALGAGIMGDEVGLLLTFSDYDSNLTQIFFVGALGFVVLVTLLLTSRKQLERDLPNVRGREWLSLLGVLIIFFPVSFLPTGAWN